MILLLKRIRRIQEGRRSAYDRGYHNGELFAYRKGYIDGWRGACAANRAFDAWVEQTPPPTEGCQEGDRDLRKPDRT